MKPNQALDELSTMPGDRTKVTTKRLRKIITVLSSHQKMLEKDNRNLRTRNKSQRKTIDVLKNRIRRDLDE